MGVAVTSVRRQTVAVGHRPVLRGLLAADEVRERGAESPTAQKVDDEVDGRVGDHQQVAEALVVPERTGADQTAKV